MNDGILLVASPSTEFEESVDVKAAARFIGVSTSLVHAYVERKQIPEYRHLGAIRFRISELKAWLRRFRVDGGISDE